MGLFGNYLQLRTINELTIGDEKVDDEEEFSVDEEEKTSEDSAENPDDTGEEEPAEEQTENPDDTGEEEPAEEQTENPDDTEEQADDVDDNFELPDDGGEERDVAPEDENNATGGDEEVNDQSVEDSQGNDADILYDTLSDDQKKIRILQLKVNFQNMYNESDSILDAINKIPKSDTNIETLRRLITSVHNVKQYILDFITTQFDKNSYLDNNQIYIRFIQIFRTIRQVVDQIIKDQNGNN